MHLKKPVILVASANDAEKSLKVTSEIKMLTERFSDVHVQNRVIFYPLISASSRDIYKHFNKFNDQISIFHYSGHSDGDLLDLENEKLDANQLSKVIGQQENLDLVFLNSCNNHTQVQLLLDKGVKAVIATSSNIDDAQALKVSELFYEAILGGKSIADAFDSMAAEMAGAEIALSRVSRSIFIDEAESKEFPWGLYTNEDNPLSWVIPEAEEESEDPDFSGEIELELDDLNEKLVLTAFEGIKDFISERKARVYDDYLAEKDPEEQKEIFNDLSNILLDSLPSILGIQIRDLFTADAKENGRLRLVEINEAYVTLIRLLLGIALADLWEALLDRKQVVKEGEETLFKSKEGFKIKQEYLKDLEEFFEAGPDEQLNFDCIWLVLTISKILKENNITPLIGEMKEVYLSIEENDTYYKAYRWMEQNLRSRIQAGNIKDEEVVDIITTAEEKLGLLLKRCAFLCSYEMVTVKDISVSKIPRRPDSEFIYNKSVLKGRDYATMDNNPVTRKGEPFSNSSVFLTSDLSEDRKPLNLSPFVIDEQNFKKSSDQPIIYFLMSIEEDKLNYMKAEHHDEYMDILKEYDEQDYSGLESLFAQVDNFKTVLGIS